MKICVLQPKYSFHEADAANCFEGLLSLLDQCDDGLLREPQLFMQRHVEAMMYDTAEWILRSYNLFEE